MQQGRYSAALPLLRRAVRGLRGAGPADPVEGFANYNLGFTLLQLGSCSDARTYLERARGLEPQRSEVDNALAAVDQCLAPAPRRSPRNTSPRSITRGITRLAPMRILVTGAAGFIGSNFVRYWRERRPEDHVVAYDLLTYAGVRENVPDDVPFVEGDIADLDLATRTLAEHEIDVVVNFAAESHNSLAVLDPGLFARTNVVGTQLLLEAARRHGVERFHHVSTCEVYGDLPLDSEETFREDSPYRPRTPYNASKAAADHFVRAYFETFHLPATISNCSNNYGPFQFPEKVIPLFVTNALDDKELPLYASTQNRREWLHVRDHCRAIELVLDRGREGETYNVGSGVEKSVEEIADAVLELTGKPGSLKTIVPDRPGHDRRYLLDSSKLRDELGWNDEIPFEQGLAETVRWYEANRAWWEPLKERAPVAETSSWR